jgi:hypothetical protein
MEKHLSPFMPIYGIYYKCLGKLTFFWSFQSIYKQTERFGRSPGSENLGRSSIWPKINYDVMCLHWNLWMRPTLDFLLHTTTPPLFNMECFLSSSDDHGFSPLHWSAKEGQTKLVEMLLSRGARVNATNMGDDIPLHLAAAHGHLDIVQLVSFLNSNPVR